jgi:hypothetical protein
MQSFFSIVAIHFEIRFRSLDKVKQVILLIILLASYPMPAIAVPEFLEKSSLTGNIRSHFQTKDFDTQADVSAYSLGGKLKFETGSLKGWTAGAAFYMASDLNVNRDDLTSQNGLQPVSTLSVLGEAYVQYNYNKTQLKLGRQKIDTPFINPSDAFIAPVTYFGYSLKNNDLDYLELTAIHVTEIKLRQSNSFEDTGQFLTKRLGVTPANTTGTTVFGVKWEKTNLKVEGWEYYLPDLFSMVFFSGRLSILGHFRVQAILINPDGKTV